MSIWGIKSCEPPRQLVLRNYNLFKWYFIINCLHLLPLEFSTLSIFQFIFCLKFHHLSIMLSFIFFQLRFKFIVNQNRYSWNIVDYVQRHFLSLLSALCFPFWWSSRSSTHNFLILLIFQLLRCHFNLFIIYIRVWVIKRNNLLAKLSTFPCLFSLIKFIFQI